jgi:plasmid stabilization system protein ParE
VTINQGFRLLPGAAQDIEEIWRYLAGHSLDSAGRIREEILDTIRGLADFPHRGHFRSDLTSRSLRFQTVREYLIAYVPEEKPIAVVGVVHGRRSPRIIATILRVRS